MWLICNTVQRNLSIPDTLGTGNIVPNREVSSFQRLKCGSSVIQYRGTSLFRTPLGQEILSQIERCPHFRG